MTQLAGSGLWARAKAVAQATPPERNRYVDFLRAFSIVAVVVGHWLVAAPYMEDGAVRGGHLLGILPWTKWLTWGFQVMPVFFLVGGFANGISWAANQRNGKDWAIWYASRMERLITPVLPLFLIWTLFAMFGTLAGVERGIVYLAAQLALIPVWFLSVYLIVTALTPFALAAWQRFGLASFWALAACAVAVDVAALRFGVPHINNLNFLFVWLAIHQLGFAWQAGKFATLPQALTWFVFGAAALGLLVGPGPYPLAMTGVPGEPISNQMPPTLALFALGIAQTGLVLALEKPARAMLENLRLWTGVVLLSGMIMTVYLWHLTAFVLVMVAAWLMGGVGLYVVPGSSEWWLARPVWFAIYIAVLLPLTLMFAGFERGRRGGAGETMPHWRLITGLLLICAGLGGTAAISIASPVATTGVRLWLVALPFLGAAIAGFGPGQGLLKRAARES